MCLQFNYILSLLYNQLITNDCTKHLILISLIATVIVFFIDLHVYCDLVKFAMILAPIGDNAFANSPFIVLLK